MPIKQISLVVLILFPYVILFGKNRELLHFLDRYYSVENKQRGLWQKPVQVPLIYKPTHNKKNKEKDWTLALYIAGDNDLSLFVGRNLKQLESVGSNDRINIVADLHLNIKGKKVSKRLYIKKNKIIQIGPDQVRDSGSAETLLDFFKWVHENYPSKHLVLDFWNHGSGFNEPRVRRSINTMDLFYFDPVTKLIHLDRSIPFFDYVNAKFLKEKKRAICFDETTKNYLTNQNLADVLDAICTIRQKEIDIVYFDACFMSMSEIVILLRGYAKYMVGSEEVELATGGNYQYILEPFATRSLTPEEFAKHLVTSYERTYNEITHDYTQSAIDMKFAEQLDVNINNLADLLIKGIGQEKNSTVRHAIKLSCNRKVCPAFAEPSYKDYFSFCKNLTENCTQCQLQDDEATAKFINDLKEELNRNCALIEKMVIANYAGANLKSARGLAIYLPDYHVTPGYHQTRFAANNSWPKFLSKYLASKEENLTAAKETTNLFRNFLTNVIS